jgi:uncharacterized membrane protein YkoI
LVQTACVCAALVALASCGHSGNPGATSGTATKPSSSWSRPDAPPDPQTLLRAGATAIATVPNSTLTFIESQTDDAGTWKVRVASPDGTEQQVKVGVDGMTVLVGPTPTSDSDAEKAKHRARVRAAHLDFLAATDKMLAAVPNGSVTKLDLGEDDGATVWKADVWDTDLVEHEVTINADSGALLKNTRV